MALPPSSKYLQRSGDPVDDVERDSLTARLNDAYGDGRISHDEYAAAMDTVYGAGTLGDLVPVVEKLPAAAANTPAIVTQGGPPAGDVSAARNLVPIAIAVAGVGIALIAVLAILVAVLIF